MTDYLQAQNLIMDQVESLLHPMIDDETITEVIFESKTRGTPEPPFLQIFMGPDDIDMTTIGSIGNNEVWVMELAIVAVSKNLTDPVLGITEAKGLVSTARNLLLTNRQLYLPSLVRKVDSKQITPSRRVFKKKKPIYGATAIFRITYIINNVTS